MLRVPSSGRWCGCSDSDALDWSSSRLKIFGVFIGTGNLEENYWRRRIDAVARVLRSWRSRSLLLSWQGPSGSLIHMPPWVPKELSCLSFSFSWSGKRDLVTCSRVVQSPLFGGFLVVDVNLKVWSLLSQWIERFASSPSGWVSLMSHWFESLFNASPVTVVSRPYSFDPGVLSPFFKSLLFVYSSLSPMCALRFPVCPPNSDNCFSSLSIWAHCNGQVVHYFPISEVATKGCSFTNMHPSKEICKKVSKVADQCCFFKIVLV